jgi:hypothetical protein
LQPDADVRTQTLVYVKETEQAIHSFQGNSEWFETNQTLLPWLPLMLLFEHGALRIDVLTQSSV